MRILIVDDNVELAENIAELLDYPDVTTELAENGAEALDCANHEHFDVALLDLRLPDMSGVELLVKLRRVCPHARYVLMTAYLDDPRVEACRNDLSALLTKPAAPTDITRALGLT